MEIVSLAEYWWIRVLVRPGVIGYGAYGIDAHRDVAM